MGKIINPFQSKIYKYFSEPVIAYNAGLAKMLGSVKAGILLCQLLFWHEKGKKLGWIYKTQKEFYQETGLSRHEQDSAIKICKEKGILEVQIMGIPGKRHFSINIDEIIKLISSSPKNRVKECEKTTSSAAEIRQSITEKTQENTHEITSNNQEAYKNIFQDRRNLIKQLTMQKYE